MPPWDKYQGNAAPDDPPANPSIAGDGGPWQNYEGPKQIVPAGMRAFNEREAKMEKDFAQVRGRDPGVDYDTGLSFMDRSILSAMDNPAERKAYLSEKYGAGNVGQDSGGTPYVVQDGKKISIEGGGFISGVGASLAGSVGPIGGATLGAMGGGALAGPPGAAVGAGIGAATGKGLQEAVKAATGTLKKTPKEEAETIATEGGLGVLGEGAGRAITSAGGRLTRGPLPKMFAGQTPESNAMTDTTLQKGGVPPLVSALPSSRYLQRHMELAERLSGPAKRQEAQNFAMVKGEVRKMLEKSGVPAGQLDAALAQVMDPTAKLSTTDLGRDIQESVRAHIKTVQDAADSEMKSAGGQLDAQLTHLNALTRRYSPGDLGVDVAKGISQARSDFGTAAQKVYSRLDKLVGDQPLVPTKLMKSEAQRILAQLPKSDNKTIFHEISELPDSVSFGDAQRLRTRLYEMGASDTLTPGAVKHDFSKLAGSVDVSFNIAGRDPKASPAVSLLRAADKFYADGIKKFNDTAINNLVRQAENGLPVDPSQVAKLVIKPGNVARVEAIKKMLPAATWQRVMGADFDNIISASTRTVDGQEVVSGKILQKELAKRGSLLNVTYGPRIANVGRELADRLSARDGDIPAANLNMDNFAATLMRAEAANNYIREFMGKNFLSELAKPTVSPDAAFSWIVKPGHEDQLAQAISHFGEQSPVVAGIRQAAVKDLLSRATVETATGTETTIAGPAIEKALSQYTAKQQEMLFPNGLADDMRQLAKEVKFLFPENVSTKSMAGFQAGAELNASFYRRWYYQALGGVWQNILTKPNVVRALALGLKGDTATRMVTRETIQGLFRVGALESAPDEGQE